jgi:phage portal protein BeeE
MFGFRFPWQKAEQRSAMSGFTAELIQAREAYISGRSGLAELTGAAQSCVSLWENSFALANVTGSDAFDPRLLALVGRALAVRGEMVFLIDGDELVPCSDWDLRTKNARPTAYRVSIPEAGGGSMQTALAGEVLHFRIGCDVSTPYYGQAPLRRARLTAGTLQAVESALAEVFEMAPLGSSIVPFPEAPDTDMTKIGRTFRGQRGRVLLRESVQVSAAGGPAPATDWKPVSVSPDIQAAMPVENLEASRNAICAVFGVLPSLFAAAAQGPQTRESQRHLVQYTLQPIAAQVAAEVSEKLGGEVAIDLMGPLQAFDAGSRSRAFATVVQALATAKEAGVDAGAISDALAKVDWE